MEWVIFSCALVALFLLIYLILFLIDYGKYGGFKDDVIVGSSIWWLRSNNNYYRNYDWGLVSVHLSEFFKYNSELKDAAEFAKIEVFDSPEITNNVV